MHTLRCLLFCLFAALCPIVAAAGDATPIRTIEELNRKRLGIIEGTTLDILANAALDFTQIVYYEKPDQILDALLKGEVDAMIDDLPVNIHRAKYDPRLFLVPGVLIEDEYALAMRFADDDAHGIINEKLQEYIADGTVDELERRWVKTDEGVVLPFKPLKRETGRILRYGVAPISPPFCYPGIDGKTIGLEVELMQKIVDALGFRLQIVDMDFADLIPSLLDGSVDIIGSCLSVTPEREELIHYTASYYTGGVSAVVLKNPVQPK